MDEQRRRNLPVLRRKRDATRYRILVEVADRQPAVSQREIAEAIGVTAQAVSEYVTALVEEGHVRKLGRGRYEITPEGVDWLIVRTDELRAFTEYVAEEVVGQVEVEAAIATGPIEAGETVTLSMREGFLHATPGADGATAVAVAGAAEGDAVGVTDFEGLLDYSPGTVTVLSLPPVAEDSPSVPSAIIDEAAAGHDILAVAGVEALAAARAAGCEPGIRFGTPAAVAEAATRGVKVLLLAADSVVSAHTDRLREAGVDYEVVDLADRQALG